MVRRLTNNTTCTSSTGENGKKGAIEVGQLADLVALTDDYFAVPEERIKNIQSVLTIVGGKIVHATEEFASYGPSSIPVLPEWSPVAKFGGYGAPLDARKAARAGVPLDHQRNMQCQQHRHDRVQAPSRYAGFWGLGCECFAF